MQNEPTQAADDRRHELHQLFQRNYAAISDAALSHLTVTTEFAQHLPEAVLARLDSYTGPIEDEAFRAWITQTVVPASERIARFNFIHALNRKVVLKAVWAVVKDCASLGAEFGAFA